MHDFTWVQMHNAWSYMIIHAKFMIPEEYPCQMHKFIWISMGNAWFYINIDATCMISHEYSCKIHNFTFLFMWNAWFTWEFMDNARDFASIFMKMHKIARCYKNIHAKCMIIHEHSCKIRDFRKNIPEKNDLSRIFMQNAWWCKNIHGNA